MENSAGGAPWRRQGSTGSGGSTPVSPPAPPPPPSTNGTRGIPPPPPPMASIPAVRLNSEVGPLNKGPPKQIQGAMMKDKKPFTYTPGGIDLFSEIRSPRMAHRIQMNAQAEGVTSTPAAHAHQNANGATSAGSHPHPHLPPAALAAMQPQLPVAVFPQGGISQGNLHRTVRPNDFPSTQPSPPPFHSQTSPTSQYAFTPTTCIPPPPPPPPTQQRPLEHELRQGLAPKEGPQTPRPTSNRPAPMSLAAVMNQSIRAPPPDDDSQVQSHQTVDHPVSLPPQEQTKTKAQAVSQQIGSIYIPPPSTGVAAFGDRSQPPQMNTNVKMSPMGTEADSDRDTVTGNINSRPSSSASTTTPLTPQLNKAPTPWLHSQNKVAQQPSPPYVAKQPTTPWGPPMTPRAIPIGMKRDADGGMEGNLTIPATPPSQVQQSQNAQPFTTHIQMQLNRNSPAVVEQPMESLQRYSTQPNAPTPSGTRIIPIQFQGQAAQQQRPQTPQQQPTQRPPQTVYNSPRGLFSGGSNPGSTPRSENTHLNEEMNQMKISPAEEGYRTIPIQSKSFKVIQRITDDEEKAEQQKLELKGGDKQLMDSVKAKVDDSSLHQTTEPRFRGGHIPSRTFQALRSHLPPSPDSSHESPAFSGKSGPVTHNIQIQMAPLSPPASQHHQYRTPGDNQGYVNLMTSRQQEAPVRRYPDENIPSRSFRIIQTMTPNPSTYEGLGSALEGSSPTGIIQIDNDPNHAPLSSQSCPPPSSHNAHTLDIKNDNTVDEESNQMRSLPDEAAQDPNWDGYWYWYWYWASYWNSLGYEYPPEGWEAYCQTPTSEVDSSVSIPSKKFKNLQRTYDNGFDETKAWVGPQSSDCDNVQAETDKLKYAANKTEDCTVPYDKTFRNRLGSIAEDENEEIKEQLTSEHSGPFESETSSAVGVVEEPPDTPMSSISEDEVFALPSQNVSIREYHLESESESEHYRDDRLSTIDELSETERGVSSRTSFDTEADETDLVPESDDDDTMDQHSNRSVIENASGDTLNGDRGTTPKDESCSSDSSSEEDDVDVESTFTIRLPPRSFTKSKSYRDIATVFVGTTEVAEHSPLEEDEEDESVEMDSENVPSSIQEVGKEASHAMNLSPTVQSMSQVNEREIEIEDVQEGIDFWGEIIGENTDVTSSRKIEACKITGESKLSEQELLNFWDKPEIVIPKLNLLRNHGQFEFTDSYVNEQSSTGDSAQESRDNFIPTKSEQNSKNCEEDPILECQTFHQMEFTGKDSDEQSSAETEIEDSGSNGIILFEDSTVSLLSASDETSDESSSKSSSATVTANSGTKLSPVLEPENARNMGLTSGKEVKGQETNEIEETEKFNQKKEASYPISKNRDDVEEPNLSTCQTVGRVAKAENLLWRIERFLQQSFTSLGSEDSGVMTDQSTQMSDTETDNDEGSIQGQISKMNSTVFTNEIIEDSQVSTMTETQRRALCYQRAKTHSRLFQLLQEECEKEDDEEEEEMPGTNNAQDAEQSKVKQCPKTFLSPVQIGTKQLLPNSDSGSLSFDSSGSLSGSSGLLSPMNRDQILVDIINQFQSRHKKESFGVGTRRLSSSIFPSKIFKMLHDEFGEEFYDAFDLSEEEFCQIPTLQTQEFSPNVQGSNAQTDHCQTELLKVCKLEENTANLSQNGEGRKKKRNGKHKHEKSIVQT